MCSFIQKKSTSTDDRVLVLVGASHAAMLDKFIQENANWQVKELQEVMLP